MSAAEQQSAIADLEKIAKGIDISLTKAGEEGDSVSILAKVAQVMTTAQAVTATKLKGMFNPIFPTSNNSILKIEKLQSSP